MIFCKKKQARIWSINSLYKHLKLDVPLFEIKENKDEAIFAYSKGDWEYFTQMQNIILENYNNIMKIINSLNVYNDLMKAAVICFIVEMKYIGIDPALLVSIYNDLLAYYGEVDKFKRFQATIEYLKKNT